MVKRDLKADLELCNEATPGPWEAEDGLADPMVVMGRDYSHYFYVHTEWDAQFIAQAREGWPHAIERALEAESLVNELRSDSKTDDALIEHQAKRVEGLESLAREFVENMEDSITHCEVCRGEYAYGLTPLRSRLCARCQTFHLLVDKAKEVLNAD